MKTRVNNRGISTLLNPGLVGLLIAVLSACTTVPPPTPSERSPGQGTAPAAPPPEALPAPARAPLVDRDAVAAYYRGDLQAAAAAYRELLEREPDSFAVRRDLVQVLREAALPLEALEELEMLLEARPDDEPLRLEAAETALFAGQPERALGYLREYLEPLALPAGTAETGVDTSAGESRQSTTAPAPGAVGSPGDSPAAPAAKGLYLSGLALMDLGRTEKAAGALSASLERQSFNPMGWYWLGTLHYELGFFEQAESELLDALAQDSNLTQAFLPLARTYLAESRVEKAFGLLRRAEGSLPGNREVATLLEEVLAAHPELAVRAREERRLRREAISPKRAESLPPDRESLPVVRVGLAEKVQELYLKTGGDFVLESEPDAAGESSNGETGGNGEAGGDDHDGGDRGGGNIGTAGTVLLVRSADGSVEVLDPDGTVLACSRGQMRLSYADPADTTILFDMQFGRGSFWAGNEDRMYRGALELVPHPDGITVVNELSVEEYLYSVLPSEMPSSWPKAALQAQAVAARSYTLANLGRFASRGFDLWGTVASAAYRGMGGENPAVRAAVDDTRGLVLLEPGGQNRPLSAFYSANCGGYTETTENVWGFSSSLAAVPDLLLPTRSGPLPPAELARFLAERPVTFSSHPDFASRSAYRWVLWVPRGEIETRLGLGDKLGTVLEVRAARRGASGRIPEVRIRGSAGEHTVKWDAIRWRLGGLRSNLIVVEPKLGPDGLPEYFVFTGAGWGHGVGLCQTGAAGMASVGFSAEAILEHYYPGATLRKLY